MVEICKARWVLPLMLMLVPALDGMRPSTRACPCTMYLLEAIHTDFNSFDNQQDTPCHSCMLYTVRKKGWSGHTIGMGELHVI